MKVKFFSFFIVVFMLLSIGGCKKDSKQSTNSSDSEVPTPTAVGIPYGTAVTKTIDGTGGTITSNDNMFSITIPPGAVSTATTFTLQPVTNKIPTGAGMAYRLLPAGFVFSLPVTVTFNYTDDMVSVDPTIFRIGEQNDDGTWGPVPNPNIDVANKKISFLDKQLKDLALLSFLSIRVDNDVLYENEGTDMFLFHTSRTLKGFAFRQLNTTWSLVKSLGTLTKASGNSMHYQAPDKVDHPQFVEVDATVQFNNDPVFANAKIVVVKFIHISAKDYLDVSIANPLPNMPAMQYHFSSINLQTTNGLTTIQGSDENSNSVIVNVNGVTTGSYPFTYQQGVLRNTFLQLASITDNHIYKTDYFDCHNNIETPTKGSIAFTQFDDKSGQVIGTVTGLLFNSTLISSDCNPSFLQVTGSFSIANPNYKVPATGVTKIK